MKPNACAHGRINRAQLHCDKSDLFRTTEQGIQLLNSGDALQDAVTSPTLVAVDVLRHRVHGKYGRLLVDRRFANGSLFP